MLFIQIKLYPLNTNARAPHKLNHQSLLKLKSWRTTAQ